MYPSPVFAKSMEKSLSLRAAFRSKFIQHRSRKQRSKKLLEERVWYLCNCGISIDYRLPLFTAQQLDLDAIAAKADEAEVVQRDEPSMGISFNLCRLLRGARDLASSLPIIKTSRTSSTDRTGLPR